MRSAAVAETAVAGTEPAPGWPALDFTVQGMTCGSCAARVQKVLARQPGVQAAAVNFASGIAQVVPGRGGADRDALIAAVAKINYGLVPLSSPAAGEDDRADAESAAERSWLRRALVVWPLALGTGYLAMFAGSLGQRPGAHWTEFALATPVQFWGGWPVLRRAAPPGRRQGAEQGHPIPGGERAGGCGRWGDRRGGCVGGPRGGPRRGRAAAGAGPRRRRGRARGRRRAGRGGAAGAPGRPSGRGPPLPGFHPGESGGLSRPGR